MFILNVDRKKIYIFELFIKVSVILTVSLAIAFGFILRVYGKSVMVLGKLNSNSAEKTIVIDPGHGGEDGGAIGKNGVLEKDLNLLVAFELGEMLANDGYTVIFTRTEDKLLYTEEENIKGMRKIYDLKNRRTIAEKFPNALFISIHMNSFGIEKYSGLQVYYTPDNKSSLLLADSIQSSVKASLQNDNKRVVKPGKDIYLLEKAKNVSVLIECGFLSNEEECKKLSDKEYRKQLCFSIFCGIIKYEEKR